MKVLIINGSPRNGGNCATLIGEMRKVYDGLGVESEVVEIGQANIRGCLACGYCHEHGGCVMNDLVNETAPKFAAADGLVVVSPVYFGSPNGTVVSFLDRLYYSRSYSLK